MLKPVWILEQWHIFLNISVTFYVNGHQGIPRKFCTQDANCIKKVLKYLTKM